MWTSPQRVPGPKRECIPAGTEPNNVLVYRSILLGEDQVLSYHRIGPTVPIGGQ